MLQRYFRAALGTSAQGWLYLPPADDFDLRREAVLEREHHQLHPVAQAQLSEHAANVGLHGRFAEVFALRDLGVAQAAGREQEDVPLARGEAPECLRF